MPVAGIAFAGDRGISKVEVSTDGGSTWKSASTKDPLSKYTWVLWTAGFVPTATQSNYKIVVRATDKTGKVQTSEVRPPYPIQDTILSMYRSIQVSRGVCRDMLSRHKTIHVSCKLYYI